MKIQISSHIKELKGGSLFEGWALIRGGAYVIIVCLGWALIRGGAELKHYGSKKLTNLPDLRELSKVFVYLDTCFQRKLVQFKPFT